MDVEAGRPILSSQENGNDMYKLTYDSDENDEINAPATSPKGQSPSIYDSHMKTDSKDAKEKGKGDMSTQNQRRTKDVATYEGNGRFYSLFSNDNFVTEDPKNRRKSCFCIGVKTALFIATVVVLAFALLGLMWVVRGIQIEQGDMERRIAKLEDEHSTLGSSSFESASAAMIQNPQSPVLDRPEPIKERVEYLSDVLKGHSKLFEDLEAKIIRYASESRIHQAESTRIMAENSADVEAALSMIEAVKNLLHKVESTADTAKHLALFALKDADLTEAELTKYLETVQTNDAEETVAFSVAHAIGSGQVISQDSQEGKDPDSLPVIYYDVNFDFAPVVSFGEELIDTGGYILPQSGTFHAPLPGTYVISVGFCVRSNNEASVHLVKNGKAVREVKIFPDALTDGQHNDGPPLLPPEFFAPPPPLPGSSNDSPTQDGLGLIPPPLHGLMSPQVDDFSFNDAPPLPPFSTTNSFKHIRPYQFTELLSLEEGDTLNLKIAKGNLVEYLHQPGTEATQESCIRFSGFKL